MRQKYFLSDIKKLHFDITKPSLVFLRGDLGSGKTTISKHIIQDIFGLKGDVTSPTYTYYNRYKDIVHFDLYRLKDYDEFFAIGGEDILDNNEGLVLVEWPEVIEKHYTPDIDIQISFGNTPEERVIEVKTKEEITF